MKSLKQIIMERDNLTSAAADNLITECREDLCERLDNGDMPYDICEEYFGLEPDYLMDLML